MIQKLDGMNYAPKGKCEPVCRKDEFKFAVIGLSHGHIYGMCNGLSEAGATLTYVYDEDEEKVKEFIKRFPDAKKADSEEDILTDKEVKLVAAAAIPSERSTLGIRVMEAGKDYFTDKTPFTTLEQLEDVKKKVKETGMKYYVYFSERLHVEGSVFAGELIKKGEIGKVLQVIGLGPHRLNKESRPDWFFEKEKFGGILCDIGSHQIEQYLYFAGEEDAEVVSSQIANYANEDKPEFEDFGHAMLQGRKGTTNYFRVDWFTPGGLRTWGDGRTVIMGTKGFIEIRKYIDLARENSGDHVLLANEKGEQEFNVSGKVGYPFFREFILDCMNRTENSMSQAHVFKAAELCLKAQKQAMRIR